MIEGLSAGLIILVIIVFSIGVHEFAHAFVANLFGDETAKKLGRLSLNPLAHWDKVGTSLLAGLLILNSIGIGIPVFGWGKPVPVNESNLRNPRYDGIQVALAGPMSNFVLAIIFSLIYRYTGVEGITASILLTAAGINIFLMFFNLLPIPPLDGSSLLRIFLPLETYMKLIINPFVWLILILVVIGPLLSYLEILSNTILRFFAGI